MVPTESLEQYKSTSPWSLFGTILPIGAEVKCSQPFIELRNDTLYIYGQDTDIFYYTLDGSLPTTSSQLYTEPVKINSDCTIKVVATRNGWDDSDVAEATYTKKTCILGDSNGDDKVDVADVVNINNYLLLATTATFDEEASDVNKDGHISVSDISATIDIIMSQMGQAVEEAYAAKGVFGSDAATLPGMVYSQTSDKTISVALSDGGKYSAIQADVVLPENIGDADVSLASALTATHTLVCHRQGNVLRVVVYSMSNRTFAGDGQLFSVTLPQAVSSDDVRIVNAVAADTSAVSHKVSARNDGAVTGINGVLSEPSAVCAVNGGIVVRGSKGGGVTVTTLAGVLCKKLIAVSDNEVISLPVGVYIINVQGRSYKIVVK